MPRILSQYQHLLATGSDMRAIVTHFTSGLLLIAGAVSAGRSTAEAAGTANSLSRLVDQHAVRLIRFVDEMETIAALAIKQGQPGTADMIRALARPIDEQKRDIDRLPNDVRDEIPQDLPRDDRHWRVQLRKVRSDYAQDVYMLSRRALRAGHVSLAFNLVRETAYHDPDHKLARQLLGYVRFDDRWVTPHDKLMQQKGNVWHETYGWIPKAHEERYEAGQRIYNGRWMSAADEQAKRQDFDNAWEIETEHFRIRTNHSLERGVKLGVLLEKFHHFFRREFAAVFNTPAQMQQLFEGRSGRLRRSRKHDVHYYRSRREFVFRLQPKQPGIENSNGLYLPRERTTFSFFDADDLDANEETLIHEVTHQLLGESQKSVPDVGLEANFWLVEGIACYLESFEIDGHGQTRSGDPRHTRIDNARHRLLQQNFFIPLRQFFPLGMKGFQQPADLETLRGHYSQASGLTHFFMHYEGGLYRDALIEHLAQIYSPIPRVRAKPQSLAELTGVSIDKLDRQYHSYLTEMQSAIDGAAAVGDSVFQPAADKR